MKDNISKLIAQQEGINTLLLQYSLDAMPTSHRDFLHLLPMLLHYDHPELPGTILNQTCPFGIDQFTPSAHQDKIFRKMFPNVVYEDAIFNSQPYPIHGIYTMGSTGTVGQQLSSDLDVWVCVSSSLSDDKRLHLEIKCKRLSAWLKTHEIDANFFVEDGGRFADTSVKRTGDEHCGSTQRVLLLDEFYRSAIRLAGRKLLWFIIPPEEENRYLEYVNMLSEQSLIDLDDWIDFGPVRTNQAEEYFGASLWHLYKSIDFPYKSALKTILLEAYSIEYPQTRLVCIEKKKRMFERLNEQLSDAYAFELDSYVLMFNKAISYLKRIDDRERISLLQRCFYLKICENKSINETSNSDRSQGLRQIVKQWGWSQSYIEQLDLRPYWKIDQVKLFHNELLEALNLSYRSLLLFARRNQITSVIRLDDVNVLSRKLHSAFEVVPGKLTIYNANISTDLSEKHISLILAKEAEVNERQWHIYKYALAPHAILGQSWLERDPCLSKLMAWAFFNGLFGQQTQVEVFAPHSDVNQQKVANVVNHLHSAFSVKRNKASITALSRPSEIEQLMVLVNLEVDPTKNMEPQKADLNSLDNMLSFGDKREVLVQSIDVIYRNSWQEIRTLHFSGDMALLEAIKTLLGKMHQDAIFPNSLRVFCYSDQFVERIEQQVYQLIFDCMAIRLMPTNVQQHDSYAQDRKFKLVKIGMQNYGFFFEACGLSIEKQEKLVDFYSHWVNKKLYHRELEALDQQKDYQLPEVVERFASEGLMQLFFEDTAAGFNVYVLDESNQIEVYQYNNNDKEALIQQFNQFYTERRHFNNAMNALYFDLPQYYQIQYPSSDQARVEPYFRVSSTDAD